MLLLLWDASCTMITGQLTVVVHKANQHALEQLVCGNEQCRPDCVTDSVCSAVSLR